MKYVTAKRDYNHKITGDKVITKGTFYIVYKETKTEYQVLNDNDKKMLVNKDMFLLGMHDLLKEELDWGLALL